MKRLSRLGGAALAAILLQSGLAAAQTPPAGAPVPVDITASQGIEWLQSAQEVIATGNAKAVRGAVTVTADQLIAHYRKKALAPGQKPPVSATPAANAAADPEDALNGGDTEIYKLDAVGHVHIYTATDNAYGDHAVYSMDDAVLVLTGRHLKLTTPTDVITARDSIEYYSVKRQAIARGDALAVANDGRSIAADILIGHLAPPPPTQGAAPAAPANSGNSGNPPDMLESGGKLQKVDAIGHVVIHTPTEMAAGDRGVYLPETGLARLGGNVHIIRGPNQLDGADALLNTKTGIATLLAAPGGQVSGVVVPSGGSPQ